MKNETVGQRIARLREERDMSRGQLGLAIQSTAGRQLVAGWESGKLPSARWLVPLAAALDCSCDYVLTGRSVWMLTRTDKSLETAVYDAYNGFVVAAGSEAEAREIAEAGASDGDEDAGTWKDPELSLCQAVTTESGIVLESFHHG